ncbi:MAG: IS1 family transposase [Clostridiaceae bacterium]|nr:IS1 family transposase [Clostridiaceae bacterium]
MDEKQFEKLLEQAGGLSPDQFKRLVQTYANDSALDTGRVWSSTAYSVSEQKLAALSINRACPGCGSVTVVQNGASNAGIQRFRCQDCGQSFTRFSGTLLEKIRFPWDVWVEVLRMVLNDDSLEVMKTVLEQDFGCDGINIKTIFAMRLKLIHAMSGIEPPKLTGVIQWMKPISVKTKKAITLSLPAM